MGTEYAGMLGLNIVVLLVLAFAGIAIWWGLLRLMDKHNRVDFVDEIEKFKYPEVYYGLRALATAWIVAQLVGRFV
jgi:hypothetical protein